MKRYDSQKGQLEALYSMLEKRASSDNREYEKQVEEIIAAVREKGDQALLSYLKKFDQADLSPKELKIKEAEIEKAYKAVSPAFLEAVKKAKANISAFHEKQLEKSWFTLEEGKLLGQLVRPIEKAAVYVPGGTAAYVSTVLMTAVPAKVAGVEKIIMATPVRQGGILPELLVAAKEAGVDEIYTISGAQGIAALAYGTETIPKVDKIVGPGNIFVAIAKKKLFGTVGIDMVAGPSEVFVVADRSANPRYIAADLLAQAEHDKLSSAILTTDSMELLEAVEEEIKRQLEALPRKEIAAASIETYGALVKAKDIKEAFRIANRVAPEHLEILTENPMEYLSLVKNAGAIFLGEYTPEPLGDYFAGPSHVLPTTGNARFSSPLSTDQFLKKSSILQYDEASLKEAKEDILTFADIEKLDAHGNSIKIRF